MVFAFTRTRPRNPTPLSVIGQGGNQVSVKVGPMGEYRPYTVAGLIDLCDKRCGG